MIGLIGRAGQRETRRGAAMCWRIAAPDSGFHSRLWLARSNGSIPTGPTSPRPSATSAARADPSG